MGGTARFWLFIFNYLSMIPFILTVILQVLASPVWPDEFPFGPQDFKRKDESPDSEFYDSPRLVPHIDNGAIGVLTRLDHLLILVCRFADLIAQ